MTHTTPPDACTHKHTRAHTQSDAKPLFSIQPVRHTQPMSATPHHTPHTHCLPDSTQGTHATHHRAHTPQHGCVLSAVSMTTANAASCTLSPQSQALQGKSEMAHLCSLAFFLLPPPLPLPLLLGPSRTCPSHQGPGHTSAVWHPPGFPDHLPAGTHWPRQIPNLQTELPDPPGSPTSWSERLGSKACLPSPLAPPPLRGKMSDSLSQWWRQAGWRGSDSASRVQSEKSFSCHYPARERLAR